MNITYALLMFLAWQFLRKKDGGQSSPNLSSLSNFLNDDTKNLLDTVSKFGSGDSSGEDKMSAIFQMMTNPTIAQFTNNIFGGGTKQENYSDRNDEGYVYPQSPSKDAKEFFKPIENIAGNEASHKLYHIYDNWYSKKSK